MKLTTGVLDWHFAGRMRLENMESVSTTCLSAVFKHANPKKGKNSVIMSLFFLLLGSARVKALHKMLIKLTSWSMYAMLKIRKYKNKFFSQNKKKLNSPTDVMGFKRSCFFQNVTLEDIYLSFGSLN